MQIKNWNRINDYQLSTHIMTIYNILFPFIILVALGVAVFILTRRLPEVVEKHDIAIKEEKRRWWQILVGKGENILRMFRVLLLKLDNKLSGLIVKVKEKKEKMGESVKDYRDRHKQKSPQVGLFEKSSIKDTKIISDKSEDLALAEKSTPTEYEVKQINKSENATQIPVQENFDPTDPKAKFSRFASRVTSVLHSNKSQAGSPKSVAVEGIIKKTFTPTELKIEKQQYWKKKEELLIQSIVLEPKNVGLYVQLGRLYSNQRNWEDARNAFLEVLKLDKTNIKAKEELKRIEKYINS